MKCLYFALFAKIVIFADFFVVVNRKNSQRLDEQILVPEMIHFLLFLFFLLKNKTKQGTDLEVQKC